MNCIKAELKNKFYSAGFLIPCILGLAVSMIHCISTSIIYLNTYIEILKIDKTDGVFLSNPHFPIYTVFQLWVGNSQSSICAKLLFGSMPILVTFPFTWSFCRNLKNQKRVHLKRQEYIVNYVSVFLSSGTIAALPLVINFLGMLLFVPATKPDSIYDIYYRIFSYDFLSSLFYNTPFLYVIVFILFNFLLYGMVGCLGLSIAQVTDKSIIPIVLPVVTLPFIEAIRRLIFKNIRIEFSPITFLFPANSHKTTLHVVLIEMTILLILTFIIPVSKETKNEK